MGCFEEVAVEEVVHHNRATDGRNANRVTFDDELLNDLSHEAVDDTVRATRAIVRNESRKGMRTLVNELLFCLGHC